MRNINRKLTGLRVLVLTAGIVILTVGFFGISTPVNKVSGFISGPPASVSGAPGEANCTSCHSDFPVNSGSGGIVISGVPTTYGLGQPVQVSVTVTQTNTIEFGFQLTALTGTGMEAGTFSLPMQNPAEMQIINGQVMGNNRSYVEHTQFGVAGSGNRVWTFTWTPPAQDVGPVTFYAAGNASNQDGGPGGDFIYTTSKTANSPSTPSGAKFDFDGDSKTDISIFRPSVGQWWYRRSSDQQVPALQFGVGTDIPVPADFTGDGKTDIAFFRPGSGEWFVLDTTTGGFFSFPFGANGDIPAPGDFDGDGTADPAVFRPSSTTWFILRSSDSQTQFVGFGAAGDSPLVGDYDNDGTDDVAIYRPSVSQFWILRSTAGLVAYQFGAVGDKAMTADFSGDGSDDIAVFRPSTGFWFVLRSEDEGFFGFPFGANGDLPAPGDYDGDGTADPTVFRPATTEWFSLQSTAGTQITSFGASGDAPVPGSYVR